MQYGNRTAVIAEGCLSTMGFNDLLHQMQSQNVGRVGVGTGVAKVSQHCFRVASAVVPDFHHKLSVYNFCRYPDVAAGGIVPDAVVQEVVYGSCQQFFVCFQRCLSCRFPDGEVNAVGFFQRIAEIRHTPAEPGTHLNGGFAQRLGVVLQLEGQIQVLNEGLYFFALGADGIRLFRGSELCGNCWASCSALPIISASGVRMSWETPAIQLDRVMSRRAISSFCC